jgi:two-component system copper resistance phosphate regulon response regulator CusR
MAVDPPFSLQPYLATVRILLVEDDATLALFVAKGLRENAYAVDVAGDGEAAVYQAAVNNYDAIVLDGMLPKLDGFAVCREIRRRGFTVPVLMLTARDAVADRVSGLDAGADDYLVKPFDFSELLARLRALLRRGPALASPILRVADLELDTRAQRAQRSGRPVPLTTKEYALLEFLVRQAGRVVGRAEISDHVWDDNYDPASNLIESYINRLRRKLDEAGGPPLIHTRRGAGYVLAPVEPTL